MKTGKKILMASAAILALSAQSSFAQSLEDRVKALEDQASSAKDQEMNDRTRLSTVEQSYNSAVWTFDNGRPVLASGDGRFTMAIRLRFQTDFAAFDQTPSATNSGTNADLSSGAVIRRAYFGVEGKVYNDFSYELRLNGGGTNGGLGAVTNPTVTTTLTGAGAGATATSTAAGTAIAVANGSEGDSLVNKAVVTYTGIPFWHFSVGVLEPAFMLEGTTSSASLMFLERPEIDNIAADSFGAGDSRRGVELGWAKSDVLWAGDNLTFTTAFTGGKTGTAATHGNGGDENTQWLGRATERLWTNGLSNIQIGVSGAQAIYTGNSAGAGSQSLNFQDRPEVRVDGTRLISTGGMAAKTGHMWAADIAGNYDNFYLGGEYARFTADRQCGSLSATLVARCTSTTAVFDHPTFDGWYVEGSWILTGETKAYSPTAINNEVGGFNAPVASRPFSLSGDSWGAWELAVRWSNTDLNFNGAQASTTTSLPGILGGQESVVAVALNWYLNRNVRLMIDDNIVHVKRGSIASPNNQSQDVNVFGMRLQFAN